MSDVLNFALAWTCGQSIVVVVGLAFYHLTGKDKDGTSQ
jgi:hypothetical protein